MGIRASAVRVIVTIDRNVLDWLDDQAYKREREKSWVVQRALLRWRQSLERDKERRRLKRGQQK